MIGKIVKVECACRHHHFEGEEVEEVNIAFEHKLADERQLPTLKLEAELINKIKKEQTKLANSIKKQLGTDPISKADAVKADPKALGNILTTALTEAYNIGVAKAKADLKVKTEKMTEGDNSDIMQAIESYAFLQATILNEDTIKGVKRAVANGIIEGKSPKQVAREIRPQLQDLYTEVQPKYDDEGNLERKGFIRVLPAAVRAESIARSEILRVSNLGRINTYAENGITKVEGLVAGDERTCSFCMGEIDGKIYTIEESRGVLPLHSNCRCFIDGQVKVFTVNGWRKIKDIQVGDLVLTHKGVYKKVRHIFPRDKYGKDVVKIGVKYSKNTKGGKVHYITATPEHPLLVNGEWKEIKDIIESDKLAILAKECKECGKIFPWFNVQDKSEFCSQSCFNSYARREQFKDPEQHRIRSIKASAQMRREYDSGIRNGAKITEKAHESIRKNGQPKLIGRPNWSKGKTKYNSESIKGRAEKTAGIGNPMHKSRHSEEFWERIRKMRKDYWLTHPEKHSNFIMAQKGFVSKPQLALFNEIKKVYADAVLEHPIKTSNGMKFADIAIPSLNIVCEYDGKYWHRDKEKDIMRQSLIEQQGWTVLRFNEDNCLTPIEPIKRLMMNHDGLYKFIEMPICSIKRYLLKTPRRLYNFSVEDDESYIVKGFVTHNCTWLPVIEEK